MSKILSFKRNKDQGKKGAWLSGRQKMLLMGVMGVIVLCYLVTNSVQDMTEGAYRMAWLVLIGVALAIVYSVNHNKREMNMVRWMLIILLVIAQIAVNHCFFLLRSVLPVHITLGQMLLGLPYAFAPGMTAVMIGREQGVFVALCTALFGMALMPADCPGIILGDYLVISLLAGLITAQIDSRVHKRDRILYAGFATGVTVFVAAVALGCFRENGLETLRGGFNMAGFAVEFVATVFINFLVSVVIGGVMPMLEKVFNLSTYIRWLEWADINQPVLKQLQLNAPGTFHHSLSVQRLAEAAAEAIGADVTRAGVCGLYHDIGKLENPEYFTENMPDQAKSKHDALTAKESAKIIIGHVQRGVEIARKNNLNIRIINVIREHHGKLLTYFFYRKAMDHYKEQKAKFDQGLIDTCPEDVNKNDFSYEGPIPQTRESGIVSMADAVESATRSLSHPTEDQIRDLVEKIFRERILDGHLQDCQITLGDIAKMKDSFLTTLSKMNHNRIAYPDPEPEPEEVVPSEKAREAAAEKAADAKDKKEEE